MTVKIQNSTDPLTESRSSEVLNCLTSEFIEYARDTIGKLNDVLVKIDNDDTLPNLIYDEFFREIHSLKGLAGTFDYPLLGFVAHRLEDYISDLDEIEKSQIQNIQIFIDCMEKSLKLGEGEENNNASEIVRGLPVKGGFEVQDVVKTDVEIMLVMPRDTASRFIDRELRACGYRVTVVPTPLLALGMLLVTRPDMICVSGFLKGLSNVDFTCALRAMPVTRDIPVALITTHSRSDMSGRGLPDDVPLIRKGAEFGDDVALAFSSLGII